MPYALHHADSGSDLEDEHAPMVGSGGGKSLNSSSSSGGSRSSVTFTSHPVVAVTNALAKLDKLPICCCRITPFNAFVFLLLAVGFALLIPGVLMRLESIPSPTPLVLLNLCRQPTTVAAATLDQFRQEVAQKGSVEGTELKYQGISISTSALSVYTGSDSYQCAKEQAFESDFTAALRTAHATEVEGTSQVIPLPDTMLYTGVTYVTFLTLPLYVVGGSVSLRMYSSQGMLFNVTTSLHLHRYLSLHDIVWLQASHAADSFTRVFNPFLPPAPVHAHGIREEDCRFESGCAYRVRAGMQSLILTSTSFRIPTPTVQQMEEMKRKREQEENERARAELHGEVEAEHTRDSAAAAAAARHRSFEQDESMLLYASNLTLVVEYARVIESNALAEEAEAHTPGEDEEYAYSEGEGDSQHPRAPPRRSGPMQFISPDVLLSFHQYELSPMQHVGVSYIIRGSILLLAAVAIAYVRWVEESQRAKSKHP